MILSGPLFAIFGTSITRQNSISTPPPSNYPAQAWFSDGYASWLRVLSGQRINLPASMNFGVSGNTFAQMLARIGDVINAQPQYCIVEGGTNDFPVNTFATIQNNWLSIISQLLAANMELSRYRAVIELARGSQRSGNRARHGFPMRYCTDAVNVNAQGRSSMMRGDEEISERREDRDEPLQAAD